jgi:hypothetical protein
MESREAENCMSEPTPPNSFFLPFEYFRPMPEYGSPPPPKPRYWLNILLLLATCFTTLVMGARMEYNFQHGQPALSVNDDALPHCFPANWAFSHPARLLRRPAIHGHIDAVLPGARDGPLLVLPALWRLRDAAVFYSRSNSDWNHGSGHSDPVADSLAHCAVRYWNRGTDRGLRGRVRRTHRFAGMVEANAFQRELGPEQSYESGLSADFPACASVTGQRQASGPRCSARFRSIVFCYIPPRLQPG